MKTPKFHPLPTSPRTRALTKSLLESGKSPDEALKELLLHQKDFIREFESLNSNIARLESICGLEDESQDVEIYDGSLGVSKAFVNQFEPPVAQLQWLDDLPERFNGAGESPGDVNDERWGTGCMISPDLFLSAGHCFDRDGDDWDRPSRNGEVIDSEEIATLMKVNFNYQLDRETDAIRPEVSFPILKLCEYREDGLDYAIIRIGTNIEGQLPSDIFGVLIPATSDLTIPKSILAMIQHPDGKPKKIAVGSLASSQESRMTYSDLDTQAGSSGSPILSENGEIVGIHVRRGCFEYGGANKGVTIGAIRTASNLLP